MGRQKAGRRETYYLANFSNTWRVSSSLRGLISTPTRLRRRFLRRASRFLAILFLKDNFTIFLSGPPSPTIVLPEAMALPSIRVGKKEVVQTTPGPVDLMDEDEQLKIVEELRKQQKSQNKWTRGLFVVLFAFLGIFTLWRLFATAVVPSIGLSWQEGIARPLSLERMLLTLACQGGALVAACALAAGPSTAERGRTFVSLGTHEKFL